jgi:hypothetical protein
MGNDVTASESSERCQGSITVVKHLVPDDDEGLFDLRIDGDVAGGASSVGDHGTTGTIAVTAERHTVSETAVSPTRSRTTPSRSSAGRTAEPVMSWPARGKHPSRCG